LVCIYDYVSDLEPTQQGALIIIPRPTSFAQLTIRSVLMMKKENSGKPKNIALFRNCLSWMYIYRHTVHEYQWSWSIKRHRP